MTVGELAIILAHVDPDLPVVIMGKHITYVSRHQRRHDPRSFPPFPKVHPPLVALDTIYGSAGWWEPAPPFVLTGPFRRRVELDEQLGRR